MYKVREQVMLRDDARTGEGVRVAVLDSGVDLDHPDLAGRVDLEASKSFTAIHGDLIDRSLHGTHVAGIIAGTGAASNGLYRGLASEATLLVYKIVHRERALEANAAAAVGAAIDAGADIINFSNGYGPAPHPSPWVWPEQPNHLEAAFETAAARGILCVVAAGNRGPWPGSITRPGGLESALTVGAVGRGGALLNTSSRGPFRRLAALRPGEVVRFDPELHHQARAIHKPNVVAPGVVTAPRSAHCPPAEEEGIDDGETTDPLYLPMSGTSQAAAVVSGLAACLLSLARRHAIDLGPNAGRTIARIFERTALQLKDMTQDEAGAGVVNWPALQAGLADFQRDPHFREVILDGGPPRLLS